MGYKVINKMRIDNNTLITVEGRLKPIRIGDKVNNGKATLLSAALSDGEISTDKVSLLVSGDFQDDELVY